MTRLRRDAGVTLTELLVVMLLLSTVGLVLMTAVVQATGGFAKVTNDTAGLTDVRTVQERISRDLRQARGIDAGATTSRLQVWIDANSDYVRTDDEVWVWQAVPVAGTPNKRVERRNLLTGSTQTVGRTLVSTAVFTYDATPVTASRVVGVDVAYDAVIGKVHTTKHLTSTVTLRNAG